MKFRTATTGAKAAGLDALFHHRVPRLVRKDGTVSYLGQRFEVPYELSGKTVRLVVDPHAARVVGVEDEVGQSLGLATALDALANIRRVRRKSEPPAACLAPRDGPNLVEIAHRQYYSVNDHGVNDHDVKKGA
jgi:hypothetical protein